MQRKKLGNSTYNLNKLEWRQNIGLFFSGHFRKKESKCALEPQEAKTGTGNESVSIVKRILRQQLMYCLLE